MVAGFLVGCLHVCRNGIRNNFGALGGLVKGQGLAADKVHNAFKFVFSADRQLQRHRGGTQAVMDHLHAALKVGADTVHLVDKADAGNIVGVGLAPHGFGLGLNAGDCVEDAHGAVKHAQGTFDFDSEVHVAGSVDDVDAAVFPETGCGGRRNGDAAFLLLLHPVHGGLTVVSFTDFVVDACVEQNTFCGCCLAGIDMGHDADIAFFIN